MKARPTSKLTLLLNANVSKNQIKKYTSDFDNKTFKNVEPLLTPNVILNQSIRYDFSGWLSTEVGTRYISDAYLNNTGNSDFMVDDSILLNASIHFKLFKKHTLTILGNNLTNLKYQTSGYVMSNESHYFAMAQRNYYVSLSLLF